MAEVVTFEESAIDLLCQFYRRFNSDGWERTLGTLSNSGILNYLHLDPDVLYNVSRTVGIPPESIVRFAEIICERLSNHDDFAIRHLSRVVRFAVKRICENQSCEWSSRLVKENLARLILNALSVVADARSRPELLFAIGYLIRDLAVDFVENEIRNNINDYLQSGDNEEATKFLQEQIRRKINESNSKSEGLASYPTNVSIGGIERGRNLGNIRRDVYQVLNQVSTMTNENLESEKAVIAILNLTKALQLKKSALNQRNKDAEVVPDDSNIVKGSQLSCIRDTYKEVSNLMKIATSPHLKLTDDDVNNYLCRKLFGSQYWFWSYGSSKGQLNVDIIKIVLIYSKSQRLADTLIEKILNCLSRPLNDSFFKEFSLDHAQVCLAQQNSIEIIFNRSLKQNIFSKNNPEKLEIVKRFLKIGNGSKDHCNCADSDVCRGSLNYFASEIVERHKTQEDDLHLFNTAMAELEENEELSTEDLNKYLLWVRRQTWEPENCEKFFSKEVKETLVNIITNKMVDGADINGQIIPFLAEGYYKYPIRYGCAEIIQSFLGYSPPDCFLSFYLVDRLSKLLLTEDHQSFQDFKSKIFICTILGIQKLDVTKANRIDMTSIADNLYSFIRNNDGFVNFYIIALAGIVTRWKMPVNIPIQKSVMGKLFDNLKVSQSPDGQINFSSEENEDSVAISWYVANILLNSLKAGGSSGYISFKLLILCLEKNSDKETRICVSEILYEYVLKHKGHNRKPANCEDITAKILELLEDQVYDVRVFATVSYLLLVETWACPVDTDQISNFFVFDNLRLGTIDFTNQVNETILKIFFRTAAQGGNFSEGVYRIFDSILLIGSEYVNSVLDVLKELIRNDHTLPANTVCSAQNVLSTCHEELMLIYEKCIQQGQMVPEAVINILTKDLYDDNVARDSKRLESYQLLNLANKNQDLSDEAFDTLQIERAGHAEEEDWETTILEFLLVKVKEEAKWVTVQVFRLLEKLLFTRDCSHNIPQEQIIDLLIGVSENNQLIPCYLITDIIINSIHKDMGNDLLLKCCQLFSNVLSNNQIIFEKIILLQNLRLFADPPPEVSKLINQLEFTGKVDTVDRSQNGMKSWRAILSEFEINNIDFVHQAYFSSAKFCEYLEKLVDISTTGIFKHSDTGQKNNKWFPLSGLKTQAEKMASAGKAFWKHSERAFGENRIIIQDLNEKGDFVNWARSVRNNVHGISWNDFQLKEALSVVMKANAIVYDVLLTPTQICSCLLALIVSSTTSKKGLLQQVVTGGGKSAIIRIVAVLNALQGRQVFVVTSNLILAERDALESKKLLEFFDLTVDHNRDKQNYIKGPKGCYKTDIVYGDAAQFQFDILRDEYSCLGTLAGKKLDVVIVDEVDSMFIDDSSKSTRLASTLPGMDQLQFIYHFLWQKVLEIQNRIFKIDNRQFLAFGSLSLEKEVLSLDISDGKENIYHIRDLKQYILSGQELESICLELVGDISKEISSHLEKLLRALLTNDVIKGYEVLEENKMKVPAHLRKFVVCQIPRWVESALTAMYYTENVHYIVDDGKIKPVDFDTTGVIQSSTNWSDGLHQFLQIKHNLSLTSETLPTNYLSTLGFFRRFNSKNIFGFTGTFGSPSAIEFISKIYQVDMVTIPSSHVQRLVRRDDVVTTSQRDWYSKIVDSAKLEIEKGRAILVICRTIRDAENIHARLSDEQCFKSVKLYTRNLNNEERHVERISHGSIIVATNLAGRGTDIKTNPIIESNGGLHVCMTFLPPSQRAEDQAIGRTARLGKAGSVQFILLDDTILQSPVDSQRRNLREERNRGEKRTLEDFRKISLKTIKMKDDLFQQFCIRLTSVRNILKGNRSSGEIVKNWIWSAMSLSAYETNILGAVEERWALFVRTEVDSLQKKNNSDILSAFVAFDNEIKNLFEKSPEYFINAIKSPFYAIRIGNDFMQKGNHDEAMRFFSYAIDNDKNFSVGAYVGKAWCLAHGKQKHFRSAVHEENYKSRAIEYLNCASELLETEISFLGAANVFLEHRNDSTGNYSSKNNDLQKQIEEKFNILGNYTNSVTTAVRTIQKSQRLIDFKFHWRDVETNLMASTEFFNVERSTFSRDYVQKLGGLLDMTFHDFTCYVDSGIEKDQAVSFIASLRNTKYEIVIKDALSENIRSICNPHVIMQNIGKSAALQILEGKKPIFRSLVSRFSGVGNVTKFDCQIRMNDEVIQEYKDSYLEQAELNTISNVDDSCLFSLKVYNANEMYQTLKNVEIFDLTLLNVPLSNILDIFQLRGTKEIKIRIAGTAPDLRRLCSANPLLHEMKFNISHVFKEERGISKGEMIYHNVPPEFVHKNKLACMKTEFSLRGDKAEELFKNLNGLPFSCVDLIFEEINISELSELLAKHSGYVNVTLKKPPSGKTNEIISMLRKSNIDFSVRVLNLPLRMASLLVKNDCIQEEDMVVDSSRKLTSLFLPDHDPKELLEFTSRGLEYLLVFNERQFIPWISVCSVCALGALQILAGGVLIATGVGAPIGMGLMTEGSVDLIVSYRAMSSRNFSWSSYAIQKSVSLAISCTTLGWGAIRGATQGVSVLQSIGVEVGEQSLTQMFLRRTEVLQMAKNGAVNLYSLAFKQAGVSVAEAAARECLFQISDNVSSFMFNQFDDVIEKSISEKVKISSSKSGLLDLLERVGILETALNGYLNKTRKSLEKTVGKLLDDIVSEENNSWKNIWADIGVTVFSGVASSTEQHLNSPASIGLRLSSIIWGSVEISNMVDKISNEVLKRLEQFERKSFTLKKIVELACNMKVNDAKIFSDIINRNYGGGDVLFTEYLVRHNRAIMDLIPMAEFRELFAEKDLVAQVEHHKIIFCNFVTKYTKLKDSNCSKYVVDVHSRTLKLIVDVISGKIVSLSKSHLIAPASTFAIGHMVQKVSTHVQSQYLVDHRENSESRKAALSDPKYDRLMQEFVNNGNLSEPDMQYVTKHREMTLNAKITFAKQIHENANDLHLAGTQLTTGQPLRQLNLPTSPIGFIEGGRRGATMFTVGNVNRLGEIFNSVREVVIQRNGQNLNRTGEGVQQAPAPSPNVHEEEFSQLKFFTFLTLGFCLALQFSLPNGILLAVLFYYIFVGMIRFFSYLEN